MVRLILLLLLSDLLPARADFQSACAAYEAGKYQEAHQQFSEILKTGIAPELTYNLGCTEAKLGEPGRAALWYYRTLLLEPLHSEARQNLRFLARESPLPTFSHTSFDQFADLLRPATWKRLTWIGGWSFVIGMLVIFILRPKRLWPWISFVSLAFVLTPVFGAGWTLRHLQIKPQEISIVASSGIHAHIAPAEKSPAVIPANPGTQVRHLETRVGWTYVEFPGELSTRGWIKSTALEPLWPYSQSLIE